jgi:hypothetical protein
MTKYAGRDLILSIASPNVAGTLTSVASTDLFTTSVPHGFAVGDAVFFGTLTGGTGLTTGKRYYVIAGGFTTTVFAVSLTVGGASFDHTSNVTAGTVAKFTAVGQVTTLGNAGSTRDLIDASAYGDPWKDYVVGQQDGTEVDVEVALDPALASQTAVRTAYAAGVSITFGMNHVASAFDIAFPGILTKFERGGERDGIMMGAATIKVLNPGVTDTP